MKDKIDLSRFRGKRVFVKDIDGERYTGKVTAFIFGKDNETGEDAVVIDGAVWLETSDISEIREV